MIAGRVEAPLAVSAWSCSASPRGTGCSGTPEDAARHDPTDEVAAFKLATEPWPGKFGVFYENKTRPTKNALEQKLIATTREKTKNASDLELLQKTFAKMR